jgi:hypothetical protein
MAYCNTNVLTQSGLGHRPAQRLRLCRSLVRRGIQRHRRAANCVPSSNSTDESPRVISTPSKLRHGRPTDLKSANTIDHDWPTSWQLLDPTRQRTRSVHGGVCQHIGASRQVPRQTEIQKDRSGIIAILERGFQLLSRNSGLFLRWCAEGAEELVFHRSADCLPIPRASTYAAAFAPKSR